MDMRDWLIVFGILVLVGLAGDAYRRMRSRNRLHLKIDRQFKDLPEVDLSGELPGGGRVRVVSSTAKAPVAPVSDAHQEPSFSDDDLMGAMADEEGRHEPGLAESRRHNPPTQGVDLLLDDHLQGVGQGASAYLTDPLADDSSAWEHDDADAAEIVSRVRIVAPPVPAQEAPIESTIDGAEAALRATPSGTAAASSDALAARAVEVSDPPPLPDVAAALEPAALEPAALEPAALEPAALEPAGTEPASTRPVESELADPVDLAQTSPVTLAAEPLDELDLNRPVPEILASVQARKAQSADPAPEAVESPLSSNGDAVRDKVAEAALSIPMDAPGGHAPQPEAESAATPPASGDAAPSHARSGRSARRKKKEERRRQPRPEVQVSFFDQDPELAPPPPENDRKSGATRTRKTGKAKDPAPLPDEVLVITVMARYDPFDGRRLFKLVEACGLSFGKMNIFHRHEQDNGEGPVQFSMVNAVHPGTFVPDATIDFSTPGVTFFLTMSEPSKLMEAFDCMLATAKYLADNLDGELRDEQRSSLRTQTIEHYRHKVRDFERRQLARRA